MSLAATAGQSGQALTVPLGPAWCSKSSTDVHSMLTRYCHAQVPSQQQHRNQPGSRHMATWTGAHCRPGACLALLETAWTLLVLRAAPVLWCVSSWSKVEWSRCGRQTAVQSVS